MDGGLTVFNNPAFQLFLMATAEPYNLNWSPGQKNMLLVSIGTGRDPNANANLMPNDMNVLYHAGNAPAALSSAAMQEQDFLCRVFGDCRHGDVLDREVGDMCGVGIGGVPKMFTYMRYNAELSRDGLDQLGLHHIEPTQVRQLDSVEHMEALQDVGRAVAQQIQCEHFRDFLG